MSKGLSDTLNIKSLDEILKESEIEEYIEEEDDSPSDGSLMRFKEMTNNEFAKDMKDVYDTALEISKNMVELGNNIDPARAPRFFEVAAQHLKIAIDASHSNRDAQLRLMKLIQDQRKLELEELRVKTELGDTSNLPTDIIMVEDRNKLLQQLRQNKSDDTTEESD